MSRQQQKICLNFQQRGTCSYGNRCKFAHSRGGGNQSGSGQSGGFQQPNQRNVFGSGQNTSNRNQTSAFSVGQGNGFGNTQRHQNQTPGAFGNNQRQQNQTPGAFGNNRKQQNQVPGAFGNNQRQSNQNPFGNSGFNSFGGGNQRPQTHNPFSTTKSSNTTQNPFGALANQTGGARQGANSDNRTKKLIADDTAVPSWFMTSYGQSGEQSVVAGDVCFEEARWSAYELALSGQFPTPAAALQQHLHLFTEAMEKARQSLYAKVAGGGATAVNHPSAGFGGGGSSPFGGVSSPVTAGGGMSFGNPAFGAKPTQPATSNPFGGGARQGGFISAPAFGQPAALPGVSPFGGSPQNVASPPQPFGNFQSTSPATSPATSPFGQPTPLTPPATPGGPMPFGSSFQVTNNTAASTGQPFAAVLSPATQIPSGVETTKGSVDVWQAPSFNLGEIPEEEPPTNHP